MKSKIWVDLMIHGFEIHPNELTEIIGAKPTCITTKGSIYVTPKGKKIIEPFNEWMLGSGCRTSIHFEDQIGTIISKLKPFRRDFLEFCDKYPPFFNIVIHIFSNEAYPYIGFENREIIKDMAKLNATFGIDYSFYSDEKYL